MMMNKTRLLTVVLVICAIGAIASIASPVQAAQTANNSTAENSSDTMGSQITGKSPGLTVCQPAYNPGAPCNVPQSNQNGTTVYRVSGANHEVHVDSFSVEQVQNVDIVGDTGSISYDPQIGAYRLETPQDGSYKILWTVTESTTEEVTRGNETVKVSKDTTSQYVAVVQASDTNVAVVSEEEYRQTEQDAGNWSEWRDNVQSIYGDDADIQKQTQSSLHFLKLKNSPAGYFGDGYVGMWISYFTTGGGILHLLQWVGILVLVGYGTSKFAARRARLSASEASLERKLQNIELAEIKQALAAVDINEQTGSDLVASVIRRATGAKNGKQVLMTILEAIDYHERVEYRIRAMLANGYSMSVDRDNGDVVAVEFSEDGSVDENPSVDDDVVEYIVSNGNEAMNHFDLKNAEPPQDELLEIPDDIEEIVESMDSSADAWDKMERTQDLVELLEHVEQHPVTDDEGNVRGIRLVLNTFLEIAYEAEKYGIPRVRYLIEDLHHLLDNTSPEEEVDEYVNRVKSGELDAFTGDSDD